MLMLQHHTHAVQIVLLLLKKLLIVMNLENQLTDCFKSMFYILFLFYSRYHMCILCHCLAMHVLVPEFTSAVIESQNIVEKSASGRYSDITDGEYYRCTTQAVERSFSDELILTAVWNTDDVPIF